MDLDSLKEISKNSNVIDTAVAGATLSGVVTCFVLMVKLFINNSTEYMTARSKLNVDSGELLTRWKDLFEEEKKRRLELEQRVSYLEKHIIMLEAELNIQKTRREPEDAEESTGELPN